MSDNPQGPEWRQAGEEAGQAPAPPPSPGSTVPMAVVPSMDVTLPKVPPIPVPELPKRPAWGADSDRRPEAGPMYPDLFQQAVAGSSLANVVTVNYADGEARPSLDVPMQMGPVGDPGAEGQVLVSASVRGPAEVGAFTGASAKKRWRILR